MCVCVYVRGVYVEQQTATNERRRLHVNATNDGSVRKQSKFADV